MTDAYGSQVRRSSREAATPRGEPTSAVIYTEAGTRPRRDRPTGLVIYPIDQNTAFSGIITKKVFARTFPWPDGDALRLGRARVDFTGDIENSPRMSLVKCHDR